MPGSATGSWRTPCITTPLRWSICLAGTTAPSQRGCPRGIRRTRYRFTAGRSTARGRSAPTRRRNSRSGSMARRSRTLPNRLPWRWRHSASPDSPCAACGQGAVAVPGSQPQQHAPATILHALLVHHRPRPGTGRRPPGMVAVQDLPEHCLACEARHARLVNLTASAKFRPIHASSRRAEGASPTRPTNRLPRSTVVEEAAAIWLRRWRRFSAAFDLVALNRKENPVSTPTRRTFIQTAVAAATSLFLPGGVRAGETLGRSGSCTPPRGVLGGR
jgi:hypothetical protein